MFLAALFTIAKTRKQCEFPTLDEWIKKMWHIYTLEYYSVIKKNEIMPLAATWVDLQIVILNVVSQKETNKRKDKQFRIYFCNKVTLDNKKEETAKKEKSWVNSRIIVLYEKRKMSTFYLTPFMVTALEKEMATHSSVLAWRISGAAEPGRLLSMGSHRVGHDLSDLAAAATW